jgi:ATP-dependent DNA helicase RecQ
LDTLAYSKSGRSFFHESRKGNPPRTRGGATFRIIEVVIGQELYSTEALLKILERHWGYQSFRPRQEAIVRAILEGSDAAVVMPTGGGKSLCYQLPALVMRKTCVVVSPLIALMQDQTVHMQAASIPAAFLNSTLNLQEQAAIKKQAEEGRFYLLYISPVRLVRDDTIAWLRKVPLGYFAVDEAHCISEWGHEFRPEYRRLRMLRDLFPDKPIAAFTASATRQVRHDIVTQLRLREPAKFALSFQRPNLRYAVRECRSDEQFGYLLAALRAHAGRHVIVYAPTIAIVEETASLLKSRGFAACAYHGKMEASERNASQDAWMRGDATILVGTLAFGLGINKPDVRAVIHLALPKSLEQYYQEAGRAGRDGLPADCVLLWQKKDTSLLAHFINQIVDPAEKRRAWQRYHSICTYAEVEGCRQRHICLHFGETPKWESCGVCDACGASPEWLNARSRRPSDLGQSRKRILPLKPSGGITARDAAFAVPDERMAIAGGRTTRLLAIVLAAGRGVG